jgi:uncharacterized membrane protein
VGLLLAPEATGQSCDSPIYRTFRIQFSAGVDVYEGTLRMNGCFGQLLVNYFDARRRQRTTVRQGMEIIRTSAGVLIRGSEPIYANTGVAHPTCTPDNFIFSRSPDGDYRFVAFDISGNSSPVTVRESGTPFYVTNDCAHHIELSLRYREPGGDWASAGWWSFDTGESAYLTQDGHYLITNHTIWYYPARSTCSHDHVWRGDNMRVVDGQSLGIHEMEDADRDRNLRLTCN